MSADDAASTDTNKQLTDMIQYTTEQGWLREVLHSKGSFHTSAPQSKYSFLKNFFSYEDRKHVSSWVQFKSLQVKIV